MPITVTCHSCLGRFLAPDAHAGRPAKCPKCGNLILIQNPGDGPWSDPTPTAKAIADASAVVESEIIDAEIKAQPAQAWDRVIVKHPLPAQRGSRNPIPTREEYLEARAAVA